MIILLILIVIVAIFGAPLFSVIGSMAMVNFVGSGAEIMIVPQEIAKISDMALIYSIPLFTFAGYILAASNASHRIVRLTKAVLGWMPGGLAIVTLIVCALFTAFTGASGVTIIALVGFYCQDFYQKNIKKNCLWTHNNLWKYRATLSSIITVDTIWSDRNCLYR